MGNWGRVNIGSGGGKLFAIIAVTYPAGSTCTCTNGTKTLKAKGTSGTAIFNVPSTGTWTVTATNGDKTASKSVSITAEGQTVVVNIAELELYKNGAKGVTLTEGFYNQVGSGSISWETADVLFKNDGGVSTLCAAYLYTPLIDLSSYDTLTCTLASGTTDSNSSFVVGVSSDATPTMNSDGSISSSLGSTSVKAFTNTSITLDISSIKQSASVIVGLRSYIMYATISPRARMTSLIAK